MLNKLLPFLLPTIIVLILIWQFWIKPRKTIQRLTKEKIDAAKKFLRQHMKIQNDIADMKKQYWKLHSATSQNDVDEFFKQIDLGIKEIYSGYEIHKKDTRLIPELLQQIVGIKNATINLSRFDRQEMDRARDKLVIKY